MATVNEELAKLAVKTTYKDFSKETIETTKDMVIDYVGATIAGSQTVPGQMVINLYKESGGAPEATAIGAGLRLPAVTVSMINSTAAHCTELENVGFKHGPNTTVNTPAALALAEKLGLTGKDVIESVIVGFEVQSRFPIAAPGISSTGWDIGSTFGVFGAAASAAKLLKLNVAQTTMALSIAASGASGLMEQTGSMTHFLEFGIAARQGLEAALLAKAGFTAQEHILEHAKGYLSAFSGGIPYDAKKLTEGWGAPFAITQLSIKKYPCCYRTHRALDVVIETMQQNKLTYDDIAKVEIDMNLYDAGLLKYAEPKAGFQSRFSMPHAIAMAILDKGVGPKSFTDDAVASPRTKEARSKVKVTVRKDWPPDRPAAHTPVKITLKDGRTFSDDRAMPRQPTREELLARHKMCCEVVLQSKQIEQSTDMMLNLEKVDNINKLMELVKG
ncbi:MAG: MmgE/PrpD family protein [Dehalococcoidales bacterium]|nr:MmgE/PrpD family protein [Dehalococcoidales bacterium]